MAGRRDTSGEHCTELGNARRLIARHGPDLRYVAAWGWLVWDGKRWERDETGEVNRRAKETVRAMLVEASKLEGAQREQLARWALASEQNGRITAMLKLAETEEEVVARPNSFDADPQLLNVLNGTLDLRTGELREHRRLDLITKLAPVVYDPDASAPRWDAFLRHVMAGNDELIGFLQRALGYSASADTREQCLFFCYGTGSNGKGVLIRTAQAALGDYCTTADFKTFLEHRGDGPREDIARLAGARLVPAAEARDGQRMAEGLVKTLTGQDTIAARFLHKNTFEFRPKFKLWLVANEKPTIRGTDEGIWRRIFLIPFGVTIPRELWDDTLEPTLQGPELPGVLRWIVEGCQAWLEHGLRVPAEVKAATQEYRAEMDVVASFLADCCILDPDATESASALYNRFREWAGRAEMSSVKFSKALTAKQFGSVRSGTNGSTRRVGLRLLFHSQTEATDATETGFRVSSHVSSTRENGKRTLDPSVPSVFDRVEVAHDH